MSQLFGMDNVLSSLQGNYNNVSNDAAKTASMNHTVGNPKLSETAASYYEELKSKHGDVEFVLVSNDKTDVAKEYTSNLVSNKSMVVLISEDEVEEMAVDEAVRTKNEQLITDAKAQMPDLLEQLKKSGTDVKSFGMEFNDDGTASYFAVVDKSIAAQKERIDSNLAEKRAEKKADAKDAAAERLENNRTARKENLTTVTASSMDELIRKVRDTMLMAQMENVRTEQEKMVGQSFDITI